MNENASLGEGADGAPAKAVQGSAGQRAPIGGAPIDPLKPRPIYAEVIRERREVVAAKLAPILEGAGERDFVWEIGCGHGHFLAAYAQAHPDHHCIGVDIALDRVGRALRKRDRVGSDNLHFVRAEALLFLDALAQEVRFRRVFVLFPDPWPKLRHHKHRLIQPAFLERLANRMTPDGRLYFRTDFAPYYLEAARTVRNHPRWSLADEAWPFEHETVFQARAESHQSLIAKLRPTT